MTTVQLNGFDDPGYGGWLWIQSIGGLEFLDMSVDKLRKAVSSGSLINDIGIFGTINKALPYVE